MTIEFLHPRRALGRRFAEIFGECEAVVSPSSSCVGTVREVLGMDNVFELSELLVQRLGVEDVGASFPGRVTYLWGAKTPCAPKESAFCRQDANFGTPQALLDAVTAVLERAGCPLRVVRFTPQSRSCAENGCRSHR